MKILGKFSELVELLFSKDTYAVTLRPNASTTYTAARAIDLPPGDANHVVVSATSTQTLTNKTLTSPVINTPTGIVKGDVGLGNVDNTSDATKNAASVTLTNKTISGASNTISAIDATSISDGSVSSDEFIRLNGVTSNIQDQFDSSSDDVAAVADDLSNHISDLTTHGVTGNIVGTSDTQNLTNKKLYAASVVFADASDPTKTIGFDASDSSTGVATTFASNSTTNHAIQIPDADGTLVFTALAQTLTDKTLTAPVINSPTGIVKGDVGLGNVDNTSDATKNSASVTLTNKTLTSPILNTGVSGTAVDTDVTLAANSDTLLASQKAVKAYVDASAGSGSGELNLISNPSAADSITGWTASGAGITVAQTTTSAQLPLEGILDSAILITPVSSTDYVYTRFTMPASLKSKKLKLEFYQRALTSYASGDLKVEVYKNSASDYSGSYTEFSLSTDSSGTSAIPALDGKYTTSFDADTSDYYEIRYVRVAGTSPLSICNVICGPGIQPQGAVIGSTQSATFTSSWAANTTLTAKETRQGSWAFYQVKVALSGAPTATSLVLTLPTGRTIDTTALNATDAFLSNVLPHSQVAIRDSGTSNIKGAVGYGSSTTVEISYLDDAADGVRLLGVTQAAPVTFANGDFIIISFAVPIAEWAGSGTVNLAQNDVEYAYNSSTTDADNTTAFAYGPLGSQYGTFTSGRAKRVNFQTPIQPTDKIVFEFTTDSGVTWWDLGTQNDTVEPFNRQNATEYGVQLTPDGASTVDVEFALYRKGGTGATYGSAGTDWTAIDLTNAHRWRLKKSAGGQAVGFGAASSSSLGLVKHPGSMVRVSTGSGHGGTGTRIRTFSSTTSTAGTDITYASNGTTGDTFTINAAGIYAISYTDFSSTGSMMGISLNASSLTTDITDLTPAQVLAQATLVNTSARVTISSTVRLVAGDIIRAQDDSNVNGATNDVQFTVTQLYKF
jgi:microcompartment protein CcmK/EutM